MFASPKDAPFLEKGSTLIYDYNLSPQIDGILNSFQDALKLIQQLHSQCERLNRPAVCR